jgi:hypothetical protein
MFCKFFSQSFLTVSVIGGLLWSTTALATPPELAIDNPLEDQVLSGATASFGWAVGLTAPIDRVEVAVDGGAGLISGYGGERADVGAAFPDIVDAALSGFASTLNTRLIANGPHTLQVTAIDMNGESASRTVNFFVSNAPGEENPRSVEVDVTNAFVEAVGEADLLIEGIEINGEPFTTVLRFGPNSNQFIMLSFVADEDSDGFRDDDLDEDGFADNDSDFDGFPDDDVNHDGLSDSE